MILSTDSTERFKGQFKASQSLNKGSVSTDVQYILDMSACIYQIISKTGFQ